MIDAYEIIIVCDRESRSHGKKHPNPVVKGYVWSASRQNGPTLGWTGNTTSKRVQVGGGVHTGQTLAGNERYRADEHRGQQLREWEGLKCLKCGHEVAARAEKLYPALTNMKDAGMRSVGITILEGALSSTG